MSEALRGVYAITNVLTDTVYYGQSVNMVKRLRGHAIALGLGRHENQYLQRSWDRHGERAFVFTPVYLIPNGDLTSREKSCIDGAHAMGLKTFNLCVAMPSNKTGVRSTDATRAKISAGMLGKKNSLGHKNALGCKHSAEARAKMSAAWLGKTRPPFSAEHRAKLSSAARHRASGGR